MSTMGPQHAWRRGTMDARRGGKRNRSDRDRSTRRSGRSGQRPLGGGRPQREGAQHGERFSGAAESQRRNTLLSNPDWDIKEAYRIGNVMLRDGELDGVFSSPSQMTAVSRRLKESPPIEMGSDRAVPQP